MSNQTTICANVLCANSGKMNNLKLENSLTTNDGTLATDTPLLRLMDTSDTAVFGPILQLQKNPVDSDDTGPTGMNELDQCGTIKFVGNNAHATASNRGQITYGQITVIANEVSDGTEAGTMTFFVAENDGTSTTAGLTLTGSADTDGVIDATLGAGTASTLSVPGILTTRANFVYITAIGNQDLSSSITGSTNIFVNVALANTNHIRLPEATTTNGGMHIRVIMGISPADNAVIGFKTSVIIGGATTTSDGTVGIAAGATVTSVAATVNHSVTLDIDGAAGDGSGMPGSILDFYYPGVANVIIYRGDLIGFVDSATLANHFSTAEVDA
jgi:hypothetical protein